jgi:hypothetical protein
MTLRINTRNLFIERQIELQDNLILRAPTTPYVDGNTPVAPLSPARQINGNTTALRGGGTQDPLRCPIEHIDILTAVCVVVKKFNKKYPPIDFGIVRHIKQWWYKNRVPNAVIVESQMILRCVDADEPEVEHPVRRRNHDVSIAIEAADFAKSEKFYKVRSIANESIIHNLIRGYLVERHVRHKDMARILPIAVALAFTPNESEIFAAQLVATPAFIARTEDLNREYYSRETPWIGNWLGRKVKPRPRPVA